MKLYELTEMYARLVEKIEDGEDYGDTLESIDEAIEAKAESIAKVIKTIEAQAKALKEEEERLEKRRKHFENEAKRLKEYLAHNLEESGRSRIKGTTFTISIGKPRKIVEVWDIEALPFPYLKTKVEPNKKAIKEALESGEKIPGAQLKEGKKTLSIR
jgi:Siphovirus Gp157